MRICVVFISLILLCGSSVLVNADGIVRKHIALYPLQSLLRCHTPVGGAGGNHFHQAEALALDLILEGPEYITRVAVNNVKNVKAAKKAIKQAFQNQIEGKGFSLVEVVSACPTNWGMPPQKALEWVESDMLPYYPIGVYKDRTAAKEAE